MELSMSIVQRFRPRNVRYSVLAGMLALPLLAGCAYEGDYYGSSYDNGYGYDYGNDYGYGGYDYGYGGYGYGYGGYGYGYGYYGSPCWPYGCDEWDHRHHRHHDRDDDSDDNDSHHHRHSAEIDPRFDPGRQHNDAPRRVEPPRMTDGGSVQHWHSTQSPAAPAPYYWIPQSHVSKR